MQARVAVIIPCFNDGAYLGDAVGSIRETEPIELVVVDDGSTDVGTVDELERLRSDGVRVLSLKQNRGLAPARMAGVGATAAPYIYPLDSDDMAIEGIIARMADRLDADPGAAVCYGDYIEFGAGDPLVRAVPERIDAYRIAYHNEMPGTSLFRRAALLEAGGWRDPDPEIKGYEDWNLWLTLAERGARGVYLGPAEPTFRYRQDYSRMRGRLRGNHGRLYDALRAAHPSLFSRLREYRRSSDMSVARKWLYPIVYGGRRRTAADRFLKRTLDRLGIWTLRR